MHTIKYLSDGKSPILSNAVLEQEKEKLVFTMINVKPFLDNELSLLQLAQIQKRSIRELSFINEGFSENFNQFINKYRIALEKRLNYYKENEEQRDDITIIGIRL